MILFLKCVELLEMLELTECWSTQRPVMMYAENQWSKVNKSSTLMSQNEWKILEGIIKKN